MPALEAECEARFHFKELKQGISDQRGRIHAVCLVEIERLRQARATVARLLKLEPGLTISTLRRRTPIFDAKLMNVFLEACARRELQFVTSSTAEMNGVMSSTNSHASRS